MMLAAIQGTRDAFAVKRMLDEYYQRMYLKQGAGAAAR
jgi:hypothetical protein